jgi:hypothetical protein
MDILNFVLEEALVMIPVIFILTEIVKKAELVKSKYLLIVALLWSLILTPWLLGGWNAENIVQAILITGMAVLFDQGLKQFMEGDE